VRRNVQEAYPHAATPEHECLQRLLGPVNENITGRAVEYLGSGNAAALGDLMREAQRAFDEGAGPVCPEQLTAPVLHRVLVHAPVQQLIWGAKGVGSQGDGTAQFLCK
jgi:galactokinase